MKSVATHFSSSVTQLAYRGYLVGICVLLLAGSTFAQTPESWKTITSKELGISVLMPPGTEFKTVTSANPKTDERQIQFVALAEKDSENNDGYFYMLQAVRLNKAGIETVQRANPKSKDPMAKLLELGLKPFWAMIGEANEEQHSEALVTRKPIVYAGLSGEDIQLTIAAGPKKGTSGTLRALKCADGFLIFFAAENKHTSEEAARIKKVLDSLAIRPADPFAKPISPAEEPAAPAPEQPAPTQQPPAKPVPVGTP